MSLTFWRWFYQGYGTYVIEQNFPADIVGANSMVVVSISELTQQQGSVLFFQPVPMIGDAKMFVLSVAPSNNKVFVRVNIEWGSPLPFQLVYFIHKPITSLPQPSPNPR